MLKIYNSYRREKQVFVPIRPGKVGMYVCGMTVYDYCHLGHGRVLVVFDMVSRWLRASGYDVTYVRNITDIDDKIIRRAQENDESIQSLTERFIRFMDEDATALGVEKPSDEPRATGHIKKMIEVISVLEKKKIAYQASNNDVYYSVRDFSKYGLLSGKSLADLRAGERVDINDAKQDPLDFVLWKSAKPGEPFWDSPWGKGRPGWHIECSAMSSELLGKHFDIHGGGEDLKFPHHENEIAQSEAAYDGKFVNYWMHNGFVRINEEKMSKSLGNFFTVREILKRYDPEVVRFFILRAHYRSPLNYSDQHLEEAKLALARLYTSLKGFSLSNSNSNNWDEPYPKRFQQAMNDDFNTPDAIATLFDLANEINKTQSIALAGQLKVLGKILGLLQRDADQFLKTISDTTKTVPNPSEIDKLIAERNSARKAKDFARADAIRVELLQNGIVLEDTPKGTIWRIA